MVKRQAVSKKIRFEVFKRDSFTCQYCGRRAPDVVLQVDHIEPVASGGTNDILNLVTACAECNSGKSDRRLQDSSVIEMKRIQLAELQERREQIEMMMEWQRGLMGLKDFQVDELADLWAMLAPPFHLNDRGRHTLKGLLGKFNIDEIAEAMRIAAEQYLEFEDGKPTQDSVEHAWGKVRGICAVRCSAAEKPYLKDLLYVRGILRKRLAYLDETEALALLEQAHDHGASVEWLKNHAKSVRNWSQWRDEIDELIERGGT